MAVRQAALRLAVTPAKTFFPVDFSLSPSLMKSMLSSVLHVALPVM